jgi:hypothetical protein
VGGTTVYNASTLEDGRDEIRLRQRSHECGLAIDDRVRHATDPELVREVREFVRLNADRPHLRRRQRHPVGQAHGPGTVGSSRRGKDHDLGWLGQLGERGHALLAQAVLCPRHTLDGVDQGGEFGPGRKPLETYARGFGV